MPDELLTHWPFIAAALVFAVLGQVAKGALWTRDNARNYRLFWYGRKTLPVHPVIAGAALGFVPGVPTSLPPDQATQAATVLYFAAAGVAATWVFDIVKAAAKKLG